MTSMSRTFWQMLQDYLDDTGATEASVMRRAGLNKGAFAAWRRRGIPALPEPGQLVRLARAVKVDYEELLNAILHETGHLPLTTAERFATMDAPEEIGDEALRTWIKAMAALGEYAALAGGDPRSVRNLINQDLHTSSSSAERLAGAVIARAVIEGRLYPPDIVWNNLEEAAELKLLIQALWAGQRRHIKPVADVELEDALQGSVDEAKAARLGTRQRSTTDRAQDEAGEENQDP